MRRRALLAGCVRLARVLRWTAAPETRPSTRPVPVRCGTCGGTGGAWYTCVPCDGTGNINWRLLEGLSR